MTDDEKITAGAAIKGMFSFFTMLPINIEMRHINSMNRKFWLVPIVGLFYGLFAALVFGLSYKFISPVVAAALTLLLMGVMNRFLHMDGTIDIGDGLTVAGKREDHVRALKDTLVGAGGIATGLMVVLLTFSEYLSLDITSFLFIGISAEVLARNAQVAAAAFGVPGNGMAGDSVRYTDKMSLMKSSILSAIIVAAFYFITYYFIKDVLSWTVTDTFWVPITIGFVISIVWGFIMSKIAVKNFGMVNGDVLGATNETSRAVMLLFMIASVTIMGL